MKVYIKGVCGTTKTILQCLLTELSIAGLPTWSTVFHMVSASSVELYASTVGQSVSRLLPVQLSFV